MRRLALSSSRSSESGASSGDWRTLPFGRRTVIIGVVNTTPDSFSGDGVGDDPERACNLGLRLIEAGADILDVGGESTRPGATPISEDEEIRRVLPAISALRGLVDVPLSVDTTKSGVARAALEAGASIVNDVSGLRADVGVADAAADYGAALILGHWARSEWATGLSPRADVVAQVAGHLSEATGWAVQRGVERDHIWLDPGLGFGKQPETTLVLMRRLSEVAASGHPVVVGPSRKGFIGRVLATDPTRDWEGAAALVSLAIASGVHAVRVHDVSRLALVARMADAIAGRVA
jgi:dihydropteroate synthase